MGMVRYANGGSDRPFWLEAYGGRGYSVERMGRDPVHVDRLAIGVVGGIQPDKLSSLLIKSDDDGLLSRFMTIWPDHAPLRRPSAIPEEGLITRLLNRLHDLALCTDEAGRTGPVFVPFTEAARAMMDEFRLAVRGWEDEAEGLLVSFIGKLPGLAARIALVLAYLEWSAGDGDEPRDIGQVHFARAAHLVEEYLLPMARRAYAEAAVPVAERSARRLIAAIRDKGWQRFTLRDVQRLNRSGLQSGKDVSTALVALAEADLIRRHDVPPGDKGGRPSVIYEVNPVVHEVEG